MSQITVKSASVVISYCLNWTIILKNVWANCKRIFELNPYSDEVGSRTKRNIHVGTVLEKKLTRNTIKESAVSC